MHDMNLGDAARYPGLDTPHDDEVVALLTES